MKAVLMSIQPRWCELIASGKKTVEVRKTKPKLDVPFKVYIYCTKDEPLYRSGEKFICPNKDFGNGKVIGEFVCDKIYDIIQYGFGAKVFTDNLETEVEPSKFIEMSCLSEEQIFEYIGNKDGYGWHISNLVIYDKPRALGEFRSCNVRAYFDEESGLPMPTHEITRPPQSYMYCEVNEDAT